jgi:K+-sensing histidine kinase KdpD
MQRFVDILPRWIVPIIGLILVAGIGYVDYLTGDYSMLIFYLIPVGLVAWYYGKWTGVVMAVASGVARFVSDSSLYRDVLLHYWNSLQDLLFLVVVAVLVSLLRNELRGRSDS